ncbi:MAG: serine hydrolase, partial [Bacteroidota bacterium]|nr:serine hydrolase [Bacteroidota bacterium]
MMNKRLFALSLATLFSYFAFSQGFTLQPGNPVTEKFSPERLQRIDKVIQQYVDSGWVVGADAFIARNGRIVYN